MLSKEEDEQLKPIANSRSVPYALVNRAQVVLMAAQGAPSHSIAQKVGLSPQMVCSRRRFLQERLPVSMMNYVQVDLAPFQMKKLPCLSAKLFEQNRKMDPLDDSLRSQGDQIIPLHCPSDLASLWASTPSAKLFQTLNGSFFVEKVSDIVGL